MRKVTIYLHDGQVFKINSVGTIPQLQRKYAIGKTLKDSNLIIEAHTIE
jgi:hypothetical protein